MKYKLYKSVTHNQLTDYGFKNNGNEYVYYIPAYKYNKKPIIFIKFVCDIDSEYFRYSIINSNGDIYSTYYNIGIASLVNDKINLILNKELNKMNSKKILKMRK